jgi:DegV family protein with EDD domain
MSPIAIVSDSTASLSDAYIAQHSIAMVPLYLKIGDKTFRDEVDIKADEFYRILPKSDPLPTTSQPSPADFAETYKRLVAQGADGIVSVHLSSGISGTINSAQLAAQELGDVPIKIVDTQIAAAGHMLAVQAAVNARASGGTLDEVAAAANTVAKQQKTIFLVETLEYLYKGGRIGGAAALVGSLLQFKPMLQFTDGRIDALERVRTSNRGVKRVVEVMQEWMPANTPLVAVAMDADAKERATAVIELLSQALEIVEVQYITISPVLGAHVGNGTIGLCCVPQALMGKPA